MQKWFRARRAQVVEGVSGKLEGNGRVGNEGSMPGFYKTQLHPFHFPHSREVGGPFGGTAFRFSTIIDN